MFENIKSGEITNEIAQKSFSVLIKILNISIVPNEFNKIKSNSRGAGIDTDEEEKVSFVRNQIDKPNFRGAFLGNYGNTYEGISRSRTSSDPSSTEGGKSGNRYKNTIFVKIRGLSFSCISLICQLNIHKSILSDLFEENKQKDIKYQANSRGRELPDLSPKSLVKLPNLEISKEENFESDRSEDEAKGQKEIDFFKQMHELFYKLLLNESNSQNQLNIMKTFGSIIPKGPYSKIPFGLVSKTVLPFVNKSFIHKNKNIKMDGRGSTRGNNQSKYYLQVIHLIKSLLSVKELRSELKESFWLYDEKEYIVFENLLEPNETNIETLAMVGKNYPEVFASNWDSLKSFLDEILELDNPKLHNSGLKLIEEWLNNFNKDYAQREFSHIQKSESDENITKVSSSSSSISKRSDEEDKSSGEGQEYESSFSNPKRRNSENREILLVISPFYLENFGAFLNKIFLKFLEGNDDSCKNIILNILSFFKEENWEIFKDEDFDTIIKIVNDAKENPHLKQAGIKFYGYIIYHKRFNQNQDLIHSIIERLFSYRNEINQQICQKNSWAVANICGSGDLNSIDNILTAKLLGISFMYAESTKEKVISNSIRALGYILSRCSETTLQEIFETALTDEAMIEDLENMRKYQGINNMKSSITIEAVIEILLDKMQDTSPKISWNAGVSLGNILEQSHIRKFKVDVLFSKKGIDLLINIIKEKPNYKTKIHATQTLSKYKTYEEFGESYFEVYDLIIETFQSLLDKRGFSEYKYIENLQLSLIELAQHMQTGASQSSLSKLKMNEFITDRIESIKAMFATYIKSKSITITYTSCDSVEGKEDSDSERENLESKEKENFQNDLVFKQIKVFLSTLKEYIDSNNSGQVKFASYDQIGKMIGQNKETELIYFTETPFRESFHHISDGTVFSAPFSK